MLVGPSLTGHAMAAAREHHLAVVSDWLHLVAGGFWVGGLFHLALALPAALSRLDAARRTRVIGRVITLFTRVAIPSVAAVFLAGLYNSWIHVGSFGALWGTAYGRTLLVKVGLTLPMLALGALNGFRFGPRADRLAAAKDADGEPHPGLERGFVRSLKVEAALGVLVLLSAAVLVFLTPGRNEREMNMDMSGDPAARPAAGAVR
jgi:copper transport protein